jgi:hypothetical protein
VQSLIVLKHLISTDCILFISLVLFVDNNRRSNWMSRLMRKVRDWLPEGGKNLGCSKMKWKNTIKREDWMDATSYKA